jgi:acyl-CoA synthetase (AMP-forming)/AMP-acid ligase II
VVMMLTHGMPAVLLEAFVPAEAVEIYKRHNVTMAGGSTAFYISFINEQRKQPGKKIIPTLRILSGGGAPKPPELFLEVASEIDARLCHGYGMTECPMISQGGPRDSDDQLMYSEGGPVEGCVITIVREDGSLAKPNEVGEVRLEGPMLLKGYRDDALNADAFDDQGRFRTGDIGFLRPDGYITLTGRLKDVIIRKGENISAKEVEDILYTHPKVGDCAVIGLIDRERGERVCAVVETAPGQTPLTFEEMVAWCKEAGLMTQKIPEQLEVVEQLPRNPTFKILKYKLRDQYNQQRPKSSS